MTTYVSLRVGVSRGMLPLRRTPKFLRFVLTGSDWATLDALDQLDDEPREGEHVVAAVLKESSTMHLDGVRNGRRFGAWRKVVTYEPVTPQPPQDLLRDAAKWREWATAQAAGEAAT